MSMYTVTLEEVLRRHDAPTVVQYLSLDVEGAEDFVMQHFPFHRYQIQVLTVERPKQAFYTTLQSHGYRCVGTISNFGETLWVYTETESQLDLRAIDTVVMGRMTPCRPR